MSDEQIGPKNLFRQKKCSENIFLSKNDVLHSVNVKSFNEKKKFFMWTKKNFLFACMSEIIQKWYGDEEWACVRDTEKGKLLIDSKCGNYFFFSSYRKQSVTCLAHFRMFKESSSEFSDINLTIRLAFDIHTMCMGYEILKFSYPLDSLEHICMLALPVYHINDERNEARMGKRNEKLIFLVDEEQEKMRKSSKFGDEVGFRSSGMRFFPFQSNAFLRIWYFGLSQQREKEEISFSYDDDIHMSISCNSFIVNSDKLSYMRPNSSTKNQKSKASMRGSDDKGTTFSSRRGRRRRTRGEK